MTSDRPVATPHSGRRQLVLFVSIGAVNTLFYFAMYNGLRLAVHPYVANALAVTASILFSFWANRRFTFQFAGAERGVRRQLGMFSTIFLITLGVSSGALAALFSAVEEPTVLQENLILIGASGSLVLIRFVLMRRWVFRPDADRGQATQG